MVLFIGNSEVRTPKKIDRSDMDLELDIDTEIHSAYEAVEVLFPKKKVDLPGLIFFSRLLTKNSIYVPLAEPQSVEEVAKFCRNIFSLALNAYHVSNKKKDYIGNFAVQLAKKKITYSRSQRISFRELLVKVYNVAYDHRADILSVVPLIK